MLDRESVNEELENAVRAVLMNLNHLHPFTTEHFNIFPYKSRWECVSELRFRKGDQKLFAYPFLITLYVETNEPVAVNHANKRVPADGESKVHLPSSCVLSQTNKPKRRKTEEPQEGSLNSDHYYERVDAHLNLQESPCLSESAEEMVCVNEIYADPKDPSPEFQAVEQSIPDFKSAERGKAGGVLARLARFAAFPISLLFRRT